MKQATFLISAFLFLFSCSQKTASSNNNIWENHARLKYGEHDIMYKKNNDNNYVLCIREVKYNTGTFLNHIDFFVFEIKTQKTLYEGAVDNGRLKWFDNQHLELMHIPEAPPPQGNKDHRLIELINVLTGEKTTPQYEYDPQ